MNSFYSRFYKVVHVHLSLFSPSLPSPPLPSPSPPLPSLSPPSPLPLPSPPLYQVRVILAPFFAVTFSDFWIADQFNSLAVVFLDIEFFLCFMFYGLHSPGECKSVNSATSTNAIPNCNPSPNPNLTLATNPSPKMHSAITTVKIYPTGIYFSWLAVYYPPPTLHALIPGSAIQCGSVTYGLRSVVAALPAWFRFAQCLRRYRDTRLWFPHLVNAGKYSTSFFVIFFSSLAAGLRGE